MAKVACARCGEQVAESALLFTDVGRVCGACELTLGEAEAASSQRWTTAIAGPLIAFTGGIAVCMTPVPVLGVAGALAAPFLALLSLLLGVHAFLAAGDADGPERTLLAVGGGVALLLGGLVLIASVVAVLSLLLTLA